MNRDLALLGP